MQIAYKDKKMIITHPSGVKSEYNESYIQNLIDINNQEIEDLQEMGTQLQNDKEKIVASIGGTL